MFKNTIYMLFFSFILIQFSTCEKENPQPFINDGALRILTLGDSRVEGARPDYESYRYNLWKMLVDEDVDFDLTGSRLDEGSYPAYNGKEFDADHEGTGGAITDDILEIVQAVIERTGKPHIVLLGIGGNDLVEGSTASRAIENITQIINQIQLLNDSATIIVEQIAPGLSSFMTPQITTVFNEFNMEIAKLSTQKSTPNSQVIVVNMAADWSDTYMADEVHYNEEGAQIVAQRYYDAMKPFLNP